jgi:hypothetical protein
VIRSIQQGCTKEGITFRDFDNSWGTRFVKFAIEKILEFSSISPKWVAFGNSLLRSLVGHPRVKSHLTIMTFYYMIILIMQRNCAFSTII